MRKRIRLTESDLHKIIKESVNRILKEDPQSLKTKRENSTTNRCA